MGLTNLKMALYEKYLHSKGFQCLEAGDLDRGVALFKEALGLEEHSYTRYDLALAYGKKNEPEAAFRELNRAIDLNSKVPEYYLERSRALTMMGENGKARRDRRKALSLDPNRGRIESIRASLRKVTEVLSAETGFDELRTSCWLPCPSFCCHFRDETLLHGVVIGPWKLRAIRQTLLEKGLSEDEYIARMPFEGEHYLQELVPPHQRVREKAGEWIFFPQRTERTLDAALMKGLPKGKGYDTLAWIDSSARACAFLEGRRCAIHDLGDEESLSSCKEFLCFTGFIFIVLDYLGLVDRDWVASMSMERLNKIALQALLMLSRSWSTGTGTSVSRRREALQGVVENLIFGS